MTAAQFIDQAKAALDDFGDRGLDEKYLIGTNYELVTYKSDLPAEAFWQCFQQFCWHQGNEIT